MLQLKTRGCSREHEEDWRPFSGDALQASVIVSGSNCRKQASKYRGYGWSMPTSIAPLN